MDDDDDDPNNYSALRRKAPRKKTSLLVDAAAAFNPRQHQGGLTMATGVGSSNLRVHDDTGVGSSNHLRVRDDIFAFLHQIPAAGEAAAAPRRSGGEDATISNKRNKNTIAQRKK